jgi:hypothetical protein
VGNGNWAPVEIVYNCSPKCQGTLVGLGMGQGVWNSASRVLAIHTSPCTIVTSVCYCLGEHALVTPTYDMSTICSSIFLVSTLEVAVSW